MELQYIPFSELVIPWEICIDSNQKLKHDDCNGKQLEAQTCGAITPDSSKTIKTMKQADLEALKGSIGQFGLLKPFDVAELPEQLDFFFGRGKYVIIDGQRRYFAMRELLRFPTEYDERRKKDSLRTDARCDYIEKAEIQAQKQIEKLSIRDYVLVPCLVYPYKTYLQMMRHSTEDSSFSVKQPRVYIEIVEKMHQQGIPDLLPDDLHNLWETRKSIGEEQQAIEKTLQEIRNRGKEERLSKDRNQKKGT